MHRNVTAIYRSYAVADLVRRELDDFGISRSHIHVVPDQDDAVEPGAHRDNERHMDDLHDLDLPDDDLRTYQQSVRRGDYVVSVEADDEQVQRVQQIMRRPEADAYDIDTRGSEFRDEELIARSADEHRGLEAERRAERDAASSDPYLRSYNRNAPRGERNPR